MKRSTCHNQPLTIFLCNSPTATSSLHPEFCLSVFKASSDLVYHWVTLDPVETADLWENSKKLHLGGPHLVSGSCLWSLPELCCKHAMPSPVLCWAYPCLDGWASWLGLGLALQICLDCEWCWFLPLDLLYSSCPGTVGLCPLSAWI